MKNSNTHIASKATELVENHSFVSVLLAVLCLAFAVNYYLLGPGSDGGSGLGGTGKFGGESGLGGTGKGPDMGSSFKLGATDSNDNGQKAENPYLTPSSGDMGPIPLRASIAHSIAENSLSTMPEFDVSLLRLSLDDLPIAKRLEKTTEINNLATTIAAGAAGDEVTALVAGITLEVAADNLKDNVNGISQFLSEEIQETTSEILVSSIDILNSLMVAEAQTRFAGVDNPAENLEIADNTIRKRVSVPVRPERPDRFNVPARLTPVQRIDIPAPPPVRPMRTLSTLLNK